MISAVENWLDDRLEKTRLAMMRNHANRTYKHEIFINKVSTNNLILKQVEKARAAKGYPPIDASTMKNLSSNLFERVYNVTNVQKQMDIQFGKGRVHVQRGPGGRTEVHLASGLFAEEKTTKKGNPQKLVNAAMQELYYEAIGYMRKTISKHRRLNMEESGYKTRHSGLTAHGVVGKPGAQTTIAGLSLTENFDAEMESIFDDLMSQYPLEEHVGTLDTFKKQIIDPIKTKYIIKDAQNFTTLDLNRDIVIQAEYGDAEYNKRMKLYDAGKPLKNAIKVFEDNFLKVVGADRKNLEQFPELKGSRSFLQKTNTIVPKTIIDSLFPHKTRADMRLKVNKQLLAAAKKDIGKKNSKGKVKTKPRQKTIKATKGRKIGAVAIGMRTSGITNPMALQNLLNELLPAAVAQNMTSPALNYRTGRFANSVRVDGITQGPRGGNTMIEATYMTNPYETFAPGGQKYTPQRDPERLIKRSIRQVASGIIGARFGINIQ